MGFRDGRIYDVARLLKGFGKLRQRFVTIRCEIRFMKQTRVVLASLGRVRSHDISFAENDPESREETEFFRLFIMGLCINTKRANAFQKKIVGHRQMQVSPGSEFVTPHGLQDARFFREK